MKALPPHYALSKYREGEALHVKRLQVMYFKGKGDETLEPQRRLIRHLNDTLHAVPLQEYRADRADTYVDKHPVIVDGNSFMAFPSGRLVERLAEYKERHTTDIASDDLLITFGTPRKMVSDQFAVITNESRENILLVARSAEQACGMSIIMAAIKSFACQEGAIHIWAYYKNRLYRAYRESHFAAWHVAESMSDICREISEIKARIGRKETGNDLVVMLGMEQICSDFDLIDFGAQGATQSAGSSSAAAQLTSAIARTAEQQRAVKEVQTIQERFKRQYDLDAMEDEWIERGMSLEEIMDEEERLYATFLRQNGYGDTPTAEMQEEENFSREQGLEAAKQTSETTEWKDEGPLEDASYNALEDFKYIVKQGSRFGYHFMLCLNTVSDIKSTHLQPELFRHKVVFQIAAEDSLTLFASNSASRLPEHVCQYSDTLEQYSLRPFIHEGISWDGWDVDADGNAVSSLLN